MLLKFRLLRSPDIFLKPCLMKPKSMKKRKSRGLPTLSSSTSALDSLVVEVSESRPFYNNFVRLELVVFCPLASLAGLVSSSSFNHSSWLQRDPRSLRAKDLVGRWTCGFRQIFASLAVSSKTKMAKNFSSWHKENLTKTKANLRWNNQIKNSSRAQMKYHTAIRVTCDNWRCILIRGVNAL